MCEDSNCDHQHAQEDDAAETGHSSQENKDLADISKYLEDDVLRNQTMIKLPAFITEARANTKTQRLER